MVGLKKSVLFFWVVGMFHQCFGVQPAVQPTTQSGTQKTALQVGAQPGVQTTDFIIKPVKTKKLSVNQLKENIGQATKNLFQTTTSMNKQLGTLHIDIAHAQGVFTSAKGHHLLMPAVLQQSSQITKTFGVLQMELASLQNKFSGIIEKLVENQRPFKKASRTDLESALQIIENVNKELESNVSVCKNMSANVKKSASGKVDASINVIKDVEKKLGQHVEVVKQAQTTMAKNACLKNA